MIHRRDRLRASKIMQSRAFGNSKIRFVLDSVVDEILGKDKVEGVRVSNTKTREVSIIPCDGVFVTIGFQPNTKIFEGQIQLDKRGYVVTNHGTDTSTKGVFVAGDVHDHKYRQAVTAAGEGCKAAIDALAYLEEQKEITITTREK